MTFAVAGVSGHTGAVVAETLLSKGKKVRVIVRDAAKGEKWAKKGAEVAVADLLDTAALSKALEGAEAAYLLSPPNMVIDDLRSHQKKLGASLVAAIEQSKIKRVVFLSSIGAQHPRGTGPIVSVHDIEQALASSQANITFLRAAYFMENLGGSLGNVGDGIVPTFLPAGFAHEMVATKDIGLVAAELLLEGGPRIVELAGPAPVTINEVARAVSERTGKPIKAVEAPLDAMAKTLQGFGMKQQISEMYQEMNGGLLNGIVAFEGKNLRRGKTPVQEVLSQLLS